MTQYSDDGNWWWDGESWIPSSQRTQSIASANNVPAINTISEKISSFSSKLGVSNELPETISSPRILISESSKKKLKLKLLTQSGTKIIEFSKTSTGMGYNMAIDGNKPILVTGKFGGFSKNTKGNGITGFKTTTSHYLGADLQSCKLIFHYKSGMMSNSIKRIEISSSTGFYFSHDT
jgi:hypothetical protein